jgi:hypothetical protein
MEERSLPAPPFARREELEGLSAAVAENLEDLAERIGALERVSIAILADLEGLFSSLDEDSELRPGFDNESTSEENTEDVAAELPPEETPEAKAARLRREAADRFERENESRPASADSDFNDITDVPPEGVGV